MSRRRRGIVWLCRCMRGMEGGGSRGSGRRTSRIWNSKGKLLLFGRVRRRHSRRVRLVSRTLLPGLRLLTWRLHAGLRVHRVALGRLRVLAGRTLLTGLLLRRILIGSTASWQRLAIRAVQLGVCRRILASPDSVRRDERLCLGTNRSKDAFLRETLAVGAAPVFGLIEAGAADLRAQVNIARRVFTHQCRVPCVFDNTCTRSRSSDAGQVAVARIASAAGMAEHTFAEVQAARDTGPDAGAGEFAWRVVVAGGLARWVESAWESPCQLLRTRARDRWRRPWWVLLCADVEMEV